jgi:hypothetical protein
MTFADGLDTLASASPVGLTFEGSQESLGRQFAPVWSCLDIATRSIILTPGTPSNGARIAGGFH